MIRFNTISTLDGGFEDETVRKASLHPLQPEVLVLSVGVGLDDAAKRIGPKAGPLDLVLAFLSLVGLVARLGSRHGPPTSVHHVCLHGAG